jgi:DNA repair protein RadC
MKSSNVSGLLSKYSEQAIIEAAQSIFLKKINENQSFTNPQIVKEYLKFKLGAESREHFTVIFMDSQNRLIASENMFSGTINQTSVYPREIVKRALELNANALILCHNHPSGSLEASQADIVLTKSIKTAYTMLDIRILDHIIVSVRGAVSMAEQGII